MLIFQVKVKKIKLGKYISIKNYYLNCKIVILKL